MIYLNNQQRNALLLIVAVVIGSLALKMAERQYQAMAFDLKGLLDGYKHSSRVKTEKPDTAVTSNVNQADTSDINRAEKKQAKSKSGKSKQVSKLKESEKININSADIEDIVRLPGIGPVLAGRIIAYRDSAGPFIEADDLLNVKGIGEKKLVKIEPHLEF
jgi:competence ComEA-like helix-hairpin-helix protein